MVIATIAMARVMGIRHVGILLRHFAIRPTERQLGAEFGNGEVIRTVDMWSAKPVGKARVDVADANFG